MEPVVFEPFFRPKVWGGKRLEECLGKPLPEHAAIGESWEISGHDVHVSQVAAGPLQGQSLHELWTRFGRDIFGAAPPSQFPLLVKYLDCRERLSIQVHPDDRMASVLLGEAVGKTECWVILASEPEGRVYAGLKNGIGRDDVLRHLEDDTLVDCLHAFHPRPGDCLFLPAGTIHAVSGGVLLAEVQQSSDATFRLYDWNRLGADGRPRELHREQALASIDWDAGPIQPVTPQSITLPGTPHECELLVNSPYFTTYRLRPTGPVTGPLPGRMAIWMVVSGTAELRQSETGYARQFRTGETVLVPASAEGVAWETEAGSESVLLAVVAGSHRE